MHFFSNDDFKFIIETTLKKEVVSIKKIPTGWTNFVFDVTLNNKKRYIFRFPRNKFFARTMKKEEFACKALRSKIPFKLPKVKLYYFEGKPFTKHNYMQGKSLTEVMETITDKEIEFLAKDIARFAKALQKISVTTRQIKCRKKTLNLNTLSNFLEGLSDCSVSKYDLEKHEFIKKLEEQSLTLSHGDFNPGNILLNSKNRMFAVLDWAFLTVSSPWVDTSRMIGRLDKRFKEPIKKAYEKELKQSLNNDVIENLTNTWNYVEQKYIEYIKQVHTDIVLPSNLM